MIPVAGWVAPFGDPGITDRSHLPRAFRSVPRPSSPLSAKASTRCPSSLVHRSLPQKRPHHRRAQGQTPLSRDRLPCPAVSHEDTSRTDPILEQRGPVRLGHIINALFTLQSTPAPRSPAALVLCFPERPARWQGCLAALRGTCSRRSQSFAGGGGERTRTDDLLLAKQALSQLSYTPVQKTDARSHKRRISAVLISAFCHLNGGPGRI